MDCAYPMVFVRVTYITRGLVMGFDMEKLLGPVSEPIQEVWIHRQRFDPVKRRNMMRTIATRIKAATVLA